jgi:hypothetical protein
VMTGAVLALAPAACSSGAASDPGATPAAERGSAPSGSSTVERAGEAGDPARPITITAGDRTFSAVLNDSDAARDFAASLPVTIPASRVGGIDYMVELPAPLTETGPSYRTVEAGDIVYWNPRNSVTVIYAPTSPVSELTKLGTVTSDLNAFKELPATVDLRFAVA